MRRRIPRRCTDKAIEILDQVRIARPRERYHAYPFELSGGMCQRVVIALALACRPQLLIADEPTTGLDVTTQKTVMDLIVELTSERGMSTILITHDLGLAADLLRPRGGDGEGPRGRDRAVARASSPRPRIAYTRKLMRGDAAARRLAARSAARGRARRHAARPPCRSRPTARPARRCWWWRSWSRNIPRKGVAGGFKQIFQRKPAPEPRGRSAPSTASASPSTAARASAWSANPAAASPRPRPW